MLASFTPIATERPSTAPAPARTPGGAPETNFADLLQRGQATHGLLARPAPPPPPSAETPPAAEADHERDDRTPTEAEQARRDATAKAAAKAAARPRDKERPLVPTARTAPAADETAKHGAGAADKSTATTDDPTALAGLSAPVADELRAAIDPFAGTSSAAGDSTAIDGSTTTAATLETSGGRAAAGTDGADAKAGAKSDDKRVDADDTGRAASEAAAATPAAADLATLATADRKLARSSANPAGEAGSALPPGVGGLPGRVPEPVATPPVALPAPVQSPEFAGQLAAQVSVWVGDGVQQAELHLNPADLGPISVQIQIEGEHAHVAFAADAAVTREAIERGLPELASALREQGLTLSGGGVFQQPPGARDNAATAASGTARRTLHGIAAATAPAGAIPRVLTALPGRLDVYA